MFSTRWLAWQVIAAQYVIEGYSISDNSAIAILQVFEFRRALISHYVKSVIYYTIKSPKLDDWLKNEAIQEALQITTERQYVDLDPVFNHHLDDDFDARVSGITRNSFCATYLDWIKHCYEMRVQSAKREEKRSEGATAKGKDEKEPNKTIDVSAFVFEVEYIYL